MINASQQLLQYGLMPSGDLNYDGQVLNAFLNHVYSRDDAANKRLAQELLTRHKVGPETYTKQQTSMAVASGWFSGAIASLSDPLKAPGEAFKPIGDWFQKNWKTAAVIAGVAAVLIIVLYAGVQGFAGGLARRR